MYSEGFEGPVTRRKVVITGAKLAYAAPLVAASFHLGARGVGAQGASPVGCFHSIGGDDGEGCMGACTSTGCTGQACDGCNGGAHPCDACCTAAGGHNVCPNADYCDADCFTCTSGVAAFVC